MKKPKKNGKTDIYKQTGIYFYSGAPITTKGVGVLLQSDGTTQRIYSDNPETFLKETKNASISWVNFVVDDLEVQGADIAASMGFSKNLFMALLTDDNSAYEDNDTELVIKLPAVSMEKLELKISPLVIIMKQGLILTLHTENIIRFFRFGKYADIFFKKIPKQSSKEDKMTIVLTRLIDENNNRNFEYLQKIQMKADLLNELMLDAKTPGTRMAKEIYKVKKMLITYMYTLWASLDVVNSLRYGDAELITDDDVLLAKINLLVEDLNRQISITEHMSEVLSSGLEVVQSIYNNQLQQLNNRLSWIAAWFALFSTAAIVPNTMATILSNPVIGFSASKPHDVTLFWILIIGPTLLASGLVFFWVRKIASLPRKKAEAEGQDTEFNALSTKL